MPYAFKANKVFAKNPDGDGYMSQTVITDKTTNDAIAEIQAAGSAQVANVNSAGTTQTTRVNTAGDSQVTAISNKATELQTLMNDADTTIAKIDALDDIISGLRSLLDLVHPVGSIYISKDPTDPGDMFGGEWTPLKDRFLLTAGDTYHVGDADGGEATHVLTEAELPQITQTMTFRNFRNTTNNTNVGVLVGTGTTTGTNGVTSVDSNHNIKTSGESENGLNRLDTSAVSASELSTRYTSTFGSNQPHNNMPPYTIVYAWERIQ